MDIIKIIENKFYRKNIIAPRIAANREVKALRVPCALTKINFRSFVMCHREAPLRFAFHITDNTMALGEPFFEHSALAWDVIRHPDALIKNHESMIGGIINVGPLLKENRSRIFIDGVSGSYGIKDPLKAFEFIEKLASDETTGFIVFSKDTGDNTANLTYHSLIIEDKLPLKQNRGGACN